MQQGPGVLILMQEFIEAAHSGSWGVDPGGGGGGAPTYPPPPHNFDNLKN